LAGSILSATDPIAVVAVFRRLKVPRTLATIVECESLFNDAVAVALYRGILVAIGLGTVSAGSILAITARTMAGVAGAIALGIALAFVLARLLHGIRRARVQIAATVLCAYGSYFLADYLHLSGIFATIAYGIALRYYERSWITLSIADDVSRFWDIAALVANGLVFFMVGAGLQIARVAYEPVFAIACLAGVAVARFAVAAMLLPFPYPRDWLDVVRVAGMRGALTLALALALPASTPYREAIINGTFAVVLATLAASSLTLVPVVRRAALR
jgi:CPA1 family monovalent cation:H+ antiporter